MRNWVYAQQVTNSNKFITSEGSLMGLVTVCTVEGPEQHLFVMEQKI